MINFREMRFPVKAILMRIWWYAAYPSSTRHLEEMMEDRGVLVDHSAVSRWATRFLPLLEEIFRDEKRAGSLRAVAICRPI
jgi:putative transposase